MGRTSTFWARILGPGLLTAVVGCGGSTPPPPVPAAQGLAGAAAFEAPSPEEVRAEARAIAREAYIYAVPLIENYKRLEKQIGTPNLPQAIGGFNRFRLFTPADKDFVVPNNDTPYSLAWLDLRAEPIVLSVPKVPPKRYYALQLIDLFTFNFAYVGVRTTGFEAGDYLVVGPSWQGTPPPGIREVFRAETDLVLILGRTPLDGATDIAEMKALQAQYRLVPLSAFTNQATPAPSPPITFPGFDKGKAQGPGFIEYLNFVLQFAQPTHPAEKRLMARFAKIGIAPGAVFAPKQLSLDALWGLEQGIADGQAQLKKRIDATTSVNGFFGTRQYLAGDYEKRAVGALMSLYGDSKEEVWTESVFGDGTKRLSMTFRKHQLPSTDFFWSITLRELPGRALYDNAQKRYSIGDRTPGLVYGRDGSLTLHIGHHPPREGDEKPNWLPAPSGPYELVMKVYGPGQATSEKELPTLELYWHDEMRSRWF
jgi:hypothetical protein